MESINASDVLEAARKMYSNIKEREKCSGELSWERCYQSFRELQNAARASERLEDEDRVPNVGVTVVSPDA